MRKRGMRGSRRGGGSGAGSSPGGRVWDLLRERKALGLRDVRPLDRPEGLPEGIELGAGLVRGRPAALVAARAPGVELAGWAVVALELARRAGPAIEAWVFAPLVHGSLRDLAEWLSEYGITVRLAAVPGLAENPGDLVSIDAEGEAPAMRSAGGYVSDGVFERVVRVVEGAGAVTSTGALRAVEGAYVLYMRGVRILRITAEPEGASVLFLGPERKQIHITDSNFPRWGPELHEELVGLAQDPRLLDAPGVERDGFVDASAEAARALVMARWMPWSDEGVDPIDWIGIDAEARPVLGLVRPNLGLGDLPAVICAAGRLEAERELWTPGSSGGIRVVLTGRLDQAARDVLETLELEVEAREDLAPQVGDKERDRRGGRRRSRRRRRGRGGEDADSGRDDLTAREGASAGSQEDAEAGEPLRATAAPPRRSRGRSGEGGERDADAPASDASVSEDRRETEGRRRDSAEAERTTDDAREAGPSEPGAPREDVRDGGGRDASEGRESARDESEVARASGEAEEPEELEIEDTLDDEEALDSAAEETPPAPAPRRRRSKGAIAVRNDLDSIITALVLARERRNVPFFYVCAQHELMDFLRGKATDIDEQTDLLLVGFTAQPVPSETIAACAVYQGQVSWFDHHEWPIEDLERLRDAIGEDSVFVEEGAGSTLAAVMEISERRSRFTDKLLDLSGRRLSENDMQKWGYNLVGLLQRMIASSGDYRNDIQPVLAGKPSELPDIEDVYAREAEWLSQNEPRLVCFGEYQMVVGHVPDGLDPGEVGRRLRQTTGARISLSSREGDPVVVVGYNEEKRHINVMGLIERLAGDVPWLHARPGGDRVGRVEIDELAQHPERIEAMIGEIVRHKSVLYG